MTRSPFPGMDPYIEAHWLDVHGSLIHLAKAALQPQLGDDLVARSEERIVVEDSDGLSRVIGPVVQRFIEILDLTTGGRVVTVIEFLSPSNKLPGDGLTKYKQKRQECRGAGVNFVEIDLTRAGHRDPLAHRWAQARRYESTYQASVWRADQPSRCGLYPISLRERLPAIRIPLRSADPDAVLEIQLIVDAAYAASRYDRTTDYRQPCVPPLSDEDATWADELLKRVGRR